MTLYHYTCGDHGRAGIGDVGKLLPGFMLTDRKTPWPSQVVWMTDLATPLRNALGLTSNFTACDRTQHRYRVLDETEVMPWTSYARFMPRDKRDQIECSDGARPAHWFVAVCSVPAIYDPIED